MKQILLMIVALMVIAGCGDETVPFSAELTGPQDSKTEFKKAELHSVTWGPLDMVLTTAEGIPISGAEILINAGNSDNSNFITFTDANRNSLNSSLLNLKTDKNGTVQVFLTDSYDCTSADGEEIESWISAKSGSALFTWKAVATCPSAASDTPEKSISGPKDVTLTIPDALEVTKIWGPLDFVLKSETGEPMNAASVEIVADNSLGDAPSLVDINGILLNTDNKRFYTTTTDQFGTVQIYMQASYDCTASDARSFTTTLNVKSANIVKLWKAIVTCP